MNGVTKFLIGAGATSLMAMVAHSSVSGAAFIDRLQDQAEATLTSAAVPGVTAAVSRDPMLSRNLVLTGEASAADRDRLVAAMKAIPGIGSVTWAGPAATTAPEPTGAPVVEAPAAPQAVADCQGDVDQVIAGKEINFNSGDAVVQPASLPLIDSLAEALKACAGVSVEVAGHTDAQGEALANMALSDRRARAVAAALTERGVPAARLLARGYGETQPKAPGGPDQINPADRRIAFKVSSAAPAATPQEG